ncbi:unnamed protein product [Ceutorhynchus assimilis]|uniref:Tyrosine-protein kinase n=1 Tax=Ceutorhynchus assimilis TaxID=467358 RepID=A0A9N9MIX5_9CUCU|nr:unnamed protein product [Ceutorhynchus assimilis]
MGNKCCSCDSSRKRKSGSSSYTQQTPPHLDINPSAVGQHPQNLTTRKIVVALYNYEARDSQDISFYKGDRMEVQNNSDPDWLFVQHLNTGRQGYIPGVLVAIELSVESEDWFFENISRIEAEKLLLGDTSQSRGIFLIRTSEHIPDGYALSVKNWDMDNGYSVKHYRIKRMDTGEYFISFHQGRKKAFNSLAELIVAYSEMNLPNLCYTLTKPCRKPEPTMKDLAYGYKDKWEIPRDEIELVKSIGEGNFGEVWYGKCRNRFEVAVKTLRKTDTKSREEFLQEGAIMKKVQHRRLVRLYGICSKGEPIYIITEYMANGSLLDYLKKDQGHTLKFEDLIYIASQVASGMAHLESLNLIHRNLGARNILLDDYNSIKICDFGLSRFVKTGEVYTAITLDLKFPVKWTAPEALNYPNIFSHKSDVWSYGVFLMELFTFGQIPYEEIPISEVPGLISSGYRMPKPEDLPTEIYKMIEKCWHEQPNKRPPFKDLEYYFESIDVKYSDKSQNSQNLVLIRNGPHCYEDHNLKIK